MATAKATVWAAGIISDDWIADTLGGSEMGPGALARMPEEGLAYPERPLWARLVFALDRLLQRRHGVSDYTCNPNCVFRIAIGQLRSPVALSDGTVAFPGDRSLDLHFWNEHIPAAPPESHTLRWACNFKRSLEQSLRELSRFLLNEPELADIQIIRADINLDMLHLVAAHYGFEEISDLPTLSFWSHLHRFGENILYWLLEPACNSGHTWPNKFWRSRRSMYLSRAALAEHT